MSSNNFLDYYMMIIKELNLDIENSGFEYLKIVEKLILSILRDDMICIEIGTWKGASACFIASILRQVNNPKLYVIDTFGGSVGSGDYLTANRIDLRTIFYSNMLKLGLNNIIKIIQFDSNSSSSCFQNESIDFIFIDGDHRYKPFSSDLKLYYPKVKNGGIICGHDCEIKYKDIEKTEFTDKNLIKDYVKDENGNDRHYGIIKSLYEFFNDDYELYNDNGETIWAKIKE